MFCGKCGSQIPDSASFCPKCGAPTGTASNNVTPNKTVQPQSSTPVNNPEPFVSNINNQSYVYKDVPQQKKPFDKKLLIIIGAAAAAVVIILLCVFLLGGKGGMSTPEQTINKLEKALNDLNVDEIMECFDEDVRGYYDQYSNSLDYDIASLANGLGMKLKFDLSVNDLDYYSDSSGEYCDVYVHAEISYSMFGVSDSEGSDETLTLIKENGKWVIYSGLGAVEDLFDMLY